jgi:hypothetical protein
MVRAGWQSGGRNSGKSSGRRRGRRRTRIESGRDRVGLDIKCISWIFAKEQFHEKTLKFAKLESFEIYVSVLRI